MNNIVKYGLLFFGGSGVGGAVSWFVTKRHYEKVMDERIAEESALNRQWYEELAEDTERQLRESWEADVDEIVEKVVNDPGTEEEGFDWDYDDDGKPLSYTERMNRRKDQLLRPERTRYETMYKEEPEKEDEQEVDEVVQAVNNDQPKSDIYVINADQFAHERYGYDKVTLYWWELERILTEEDLDILDVPDLLGTNWESRIGEYEKDVVYVRNENMETDYEVIARHESFYEERGF